jgi:methylenetetrahydrofolate reductase (NADH)
MRPSGTGGPAAGALAPGLREALAALARGASSETATHRPAEIDGYGALVPPGSRIYVAWVPGSTPGRIVDAAVRLRRAGLEPVPHLAARELESEAAAAGLLARLHGEAGVREALLIAGDRPQPRGPYADSVALLRSGLPARHGLVRIGLAGYPEGHPRIGPDALAAALAAKTALAAAAGLEAFVVSQFCFDGEAMLAWLRGLRARGVTLPVYLGLAGPAGVATLVRYGMRCGVGNSLRFLSARPRQLGRLAASHGPQALLTRLAEAIAAQPAAQAATGDAPGLGIAGVHLFSFGGFAATADWLRRVAAGRIEPDGAEGFRVLED